MINGMSLTFKGDQIDFIITVFLGFGCFFSWISVLEVLSLYQNFRLVSQTLAISTPSVFWFAVGTSPIFLAYVFQGYCFYHENPQFKTLQTSYFTMLALFAGDEIVEYINQARSMPFSDFFGYSYVFIFLLVIANVFVFLIESGYQTELGNMEKRRERMQQ
jgi:hypothetical protein